MLKLGSTKLVVQQWKELAELAGISKVAGLSRLANLWRYSKNTESVEPIPIK